VTDTTTDKKRRFLSDAEMFKAYGMMNEHLVRVVDGPNPLFAYDPDWSDQRIADEVGCTINNVAGLRDRNFGKLTKAPEIQRDPRVEHLIAAHDEFVRDIIKHLNEGMKGEIDPTPYLVAGDRP
jgi:hypothetical protein